MNRFVEIVLIALAVLMVIWFVATVRSACADTIKFTWDYAVEDEPYMSVFRIYDSKDRGRVWGIRKDRRSMIVQFTRAGCEEFTLKAVAKYDNGDEAISDASNPTTVCVEGNDNIVNAPFNFDGQNLSTQPER